MRRTTKLACVALAIALPATALAAARTYEGTGTDDPAAKIELRVVKRDGTRFVKRIVADRLRYETSAFCSSNGRTDEQPLRGRFRVRGDNTFRAVGATVPDDVATSGQLRVKGEVRRARAKGTMRFVFGKDGCKTNVTEWTATR